MVNESVMFIPCVDCHGSGSKQGTIRASFADLQEMFGKPAFEGKGDNITTEFVLDIEYWDGIDEDRQRDSVCLYDWGYARNFGNDYEEIDWNVGGDGFMASLYIDKALEIFKKTDIRYGSNEACMAQARIHDWKVDSTDWEINDWEKDSE